MEMKQIVSKLSIHQSHSFSFHSPVLFVIIFPSKMGADDDFNDRMLPFVYDLKKDSLVYIENAKQLSLLREAFLDCIAIGIDTERKPDGYKGLKHPTSIIQLATRLSNGEEKVFILDLLSLCIDEAAVSELSTAFEVVMKNDSCIKIGQGLFRDFLEVVQSYPSLTSFHKVNGVVDTEVLYRLLEPAAVHMISLKRLVKNYLNLRLSKDEQLSNWADRPLSSSQLHYAANDALVLLRLYDAMLWEVQDKYLTEFDKQFEVSTVCQSFNFLGNRELSPMKVQKLLLSSSHKKENKRSMCNSFSVHDDDSVNSSVSKKLKL
jgi:ribonuclease D